MVIHYHKQQRQSFIYNSLHYEGILYNKLPYSQNLSFEEWNGIQQPRPLQIYLSENKCFSKIIQQKLHSNVFSFFFFDLVCQIKQNLELLHDIIHSQRATLPPPATLLLVTDGRDSSSNPT